MANGRMAEWPNGRMSECPNVEVQNRYNSTLYILTFGYEIICVLFYSPLHRLNFALFTMLVIANWLYVFQISTIHCQNV